MSVFFNAVSTKIFVLVRYPATAATPSGFLPKRGLQLSHQRGLQVWQKQLQKGQPLLKHEEDSPSPCMTESCFARRRGTLVILYRKKQRQAIPSSTRRNNEHIGKALKQSGLRNLNAVGSAESIRNRGVWDFFQAGTVWGKWTWGRPCRQRWWWTNPM